MASLDSLPPDQRAVLQLVLQRGRTYDDIVQLLSIDRAAVRDRALAALDQLGPETRVPAERRSMITDYLLGQLPEQVGEQVRERLAQSASERAWARVVASELAPLASRPLPEIPTDAESAAPSREGEPAPGGAVAQEPPQTPQAPEPIPLPGAYGSQEPPADPRPSSRRGGAALLALGALIAVVVVIVIIASNGSSSKRSSSTTSAASTPARTTTTAPQVVAQINLISPTRSKTAGIAEVLRQGSANGIALVAQNVAPNTKHDAYAVWLYNSPSDSKLLGFVNPGVGSNGRLSTAGALPSNAAHFKQLIVTLETQANPHAPGKIVLQGALTGV